MSRNMTGFVPGGIQSRQLPSAIQPGELVVHAVGRLNTMAEMLVQSACLRSANFVSQATGYGKAKFQDVIGDYSGTNKIAAAHRAMFALYLDGRNAADVPPVLKRPRLRQMVIAPQARTDLVSRPVNYADQLLEYAVSPQLFELFRITLAFQPPGKAVEKNLLVETAFKMKRVIHDGFDRAADAFLTAQRRRGWQEFRPGSGPAPLAGVTDSETNSFLDAAFAGGMTPHVAGPTHYGDLTEVVLAISQEITDKATPAISLPSEMEALIASIESATKDLHPSD